MEHDAQHGHGGDEESGWRSPAPRPHPKPEPKAPASLNHAVRQQLWYVDTMMAMPFRTMRRLLRTRGGRASPLVEGMDELIWAAEGMTRLPLKLVQAAFGEELGGGDAKPGKAVPRAETGSESAPRRHEKS